MELGDTCSACGLTCTKKEKVKSETGVVTYVDPCLGKLPGVKFACCGHGKRHGYMFFENGVTIRFGRLTDVEHKTYSAYHSFNDKTAERKQH